MALTAEQLRSLIVTEVGDVGGLIAGQITTLWELHAGETDLYLHYLLTKRSAIGVLMGSVREQVNQQVESASKDLSDKLEHLQTMWENVDAEIRTARTQADLATQQTASTSRPPRVGQLTATLGGVSGVVR